MVDRIHRLASCLARLSCIIVLGASIRSLRFLRATFYRISENRTEKLRRKSPRSFLLSDKNGFSWARRLLQVRGNIALLAMQVQNVRTCETLKVNAMRAMDEFHGDKLAVRGKIGKKTYG